MNVKSWIRVSILFTIIFNYFLSISQERIYTTVHIEGESPVIDGVIDESVWDIASWSNDFTQREPYENQPPTQSTSFKILYDISNLYIAIRAFDSEPGKIEKRLTRRDGFEGDWVAVGIDSYNDKLTGFSFGVNAAGVKGDGIVTNDNDFDVTWDPVWYVKVSIDELGWVAEMKIPFNQLRFASEKEHTWGLEVIRWLFRKEEMSLWQMVPVDAGGWTSEWGELTGINNINPKREIEIIPYGMMKFETYEKEEGNPFITGSDWGFNAGVDGKIAITNDFTLNFTANPDFGQVEADPSEVNLSAFETFFEEKRPFFVEGSNIYDYPLTGGDGGFSRDNLFYSRRIGIRPHYELDLIDSEYANIPEYTTILGAVKLSGKTKNGWSIGILESLTNEEKAIIDYNGDRRKEVIEPATNFFNTRIQKDLNNGNTQIGGMVTATNRFIYDSALNFLPTSAYTSGVDFRNFWKDKSYYLSAKASVSVINGSTDAITYLQESAQHYFQRPDASHLKVDTTLTTLSGTGGTIEGGKIGGGHWSMGGWTTWRSPGLELNDMGYMRQADFINQVGWVGYRIWEPVGIFRSINFNMAAWSGWDFSGTHIYSGGNFNINSQFKNYWRLGTGINREGIDINRHELRGGPALRTPGTLSSWFHISTDDRKKLGFSLSASNNLGDNNYRRSVNYSMEITYQPTDFLQLSLEPSYHWSYNEIIYVETIDYKNVNRYIVSGIDQEFVSMDIRVNIGITPDLSIQYWGQPFLFSGDYFDFRKVINPMADNFEDQFHTFTPGEINYDKVKDIYTIHEGVDLYAFADPDFSFFEFRSNLVVRWEYIPGSSAYLVWSQGRTGDHPDGAFSLSENIDRLSSLVPHNVFLLKLSYRFSF
ncbi:MAG: carbohydrate binding family 9 domain-containing protein [Bacteroidetes bacterium]|nr:carbohydrate binding family 9 domain-containing protein [Bacteroidota bacterium]MBL6942954.1 carbohydrate binding family 9 domain-containing protein [Bacteroidales bacterium]